MSESPDTAGQNAQDDHATFLELLGTYSMTLAVIFIWFLAAISLDDQPHGLQLANLIGYSGAAFALIFFRNRASNTRYRLTAPYVRRLLPHLVLMHCAYLLVLYVGTGWTLTRRPPLPPYLWEAGLALLSVSQEFLSKRMLARAKTESTSETAANDSRVTP